MLETEQSRNNERLSEDKIELIDLLTVAWKWKLLIIGGTLALGLAAAIYGFNMAKIYRTEMVLRPGILTIRDDGKKEYIETPENIKALINAGTFNNMIINRLKEKGYKNQIPQTIQFGIEASKDANVLKISYLTADVEIGIEILKILYNQLMDEYGKIVKIYKDTFQSEITIRKANIKKLNDNKSSYEMNADNIERRIKELESEIDSITSNTKYLLQERSKFLENHASENKILSGILYSNTIQQNLSLANTYKERVKDNRLQKEAQLQAINEVENAIQQNLADIKKIEFKIENIENIQNILPPSSTPYPIKPKIKLMVLLGVVAGLVLSLLSAFFLEYILKFRGIDIPSN